MLIRTATSRINILVESATLCLRMGTGLVIFDSHSLVTNAPVEVFPLKTLPCKPVSALGTGSISLHQLE